MKIKASAIARYVEGYAKVWPFSGVIQVQHRDSIAYEHVGGMACYEFGVANSIDTCFMLGSASKQFTAFAVMQLADKGLCDLDAPANFYLPPSRRIDGRITMHHLLSHTSGLNGLNACEAVLPGGYSLRLQCDEDFHQRCLSMPLKSIPGAKFCYSSLGYKALSWAVEAMSGCPFSEYLRERVFQPLGMLRSAMDDGAIVIGKKAFQYSLGACDAIVRSAHWGSKPGVCVSTAPDLRTWHRSLRRGDLLSPQAYARFLRCCANVGLHIGNPPVEAAMGQGGYMGRPSAYARYFPKSDVSVIILSNCDWIDQRRMGESISDIVMDGI